MPGAVRTLVRLRTSVGRAARRRVPGPRDGRGLPRVPARHRRRAGDRRRRPRPDGTPGRAAARGRTARSPTGCVPSSSRGAGPDRRPTARSTAGDTCRCPDAAGRRRPAICDAADPSDATDVSADFVFGTLATDDLRLAQLRAAAVRASATATTSSRSIPRPASRSTIGVTLGPGRRRGPGDRLRHDRRSRSGRRPRRRDRRRWRSRWTASTSTGTRCLWGYRETLARDDPGPARRDARPVSDRGLVERRDRRRPGRRRSPGSSPASGRAGVSDLDAATFAVAGAAELWPIRRTAADAVPRRPRARPRLAPRRRHLPGRSSIASRRPAACRSPSPPTPGGFYGGTLRGVIERLDHIVDLGVTCLWLSPVFPSPSHHGYDATDYRRVEPRLGTEADLRELVDAAHARRHPRDPRLRRQPRLVGAPGVPGRAGATATRPRRAGSRSRDWPDRLPLVLRRRATIRSSIPTIPGARAYLIDSRPALARASASTGSAATTRRVRRTRSGARSGRRPGRSRRTASPSARSSRRRRCSGRIAGRLDGCLDFVLQQALRGCFALRDARAERARRVPAPASRVLRRMTSSCRPSSTTTT